MLFVEDVLPGSTKSDGQCNLHIDMRKAKNDLNERDITCRTEEQNIDHGCSTLKVSSGLPRLVSTRYMNRTS